MQTTIPNITRMIAGLFGLLWSLVEPSINFIAICALAMALDCYTAWRCNRRIYAKYEKQIKQNPDCKIDGKLRSKKMTKMVQDFSVLVGAIFLALAIDKGIFGYMEPLHLANYLAAIYCAVQFVSVLENESTCNGAAWAKVLQKIVADKTERHFDIDIREIIKKDDQ